MQTCSPVDWDLPSGQDQERHLHVLLRPTAVKCAQPWPKTPIYTELENAEWPLYAFLPVLPHLISEGFEGGT